MPGLSFVNTLVSYRNVLLATTVVSAIALPQIVSAFDGSSSGRMIVAQKEDPKKKAQPPAKAPPPPQKQVQPPKAPPPPPQKQVQPPRAPSPPPVQKQVQPPKAPPPPQKQVQPPPPPKAPLQKQVQPPPSVQQPKQVQPQPKQVPPQLQQPQPKQVQPQPGQQPQLQPQPKQVQPQPGQQPQLQPQPKQVQPQPGQQPQLQPQPKQVQPQPGQQPQLQPQPKQVQPQPGQQPQLQPQPKQVQPQPGQQPQLQPQPKQVQPQPGQQPQLQPQPKQVQQPPITPQKFGAPKAPPPDARVGNVNELKGKRKEERVGNTTVIVEPGNRRIYREGNRVFIRHDESERMRRWGNARFETRGNDRYTIVNRGGYDVITVTDGRGHMLRRYRRFPDGREYGLIDNRRRWGGAAVIGGAVVGGAVLLGLAMPMITIPRERYIVDMETAPPGYLYDALDAPPLMAMERPYSLDEVRDNYELRARVRSVDINSINFATGSWEISPDQIPRLQGLADAMLKVISENPSTVFLIEGHTDAVGAAEDNMSLSDRRAEAVAEVLTTNFNIPPENLVTQGYGEQHLRVQTDGPSRENRRVEVRNVTGLMAAGDGQPGGPDGPPQGQPPG